MESTMREAPPAPMISRPDTASRDTPVPAGACVEKDMGPSIPLRLIKGYCGFGSHSLDTGLRHLSLSTLGYAFSYQLISLNLRGVERKTPWDRRIHLGEQEVSWTPPSSFPGSRRATPTHIHIFSRLFPQTKHSKPQHLLPHTQEPRCPLIFLQEPTGPTHL